MEGSSGGAAARWLELLPLPRGPRWWWWVLGEGGMNYHVAWGEILRTQNCGTRYRCLAVVISEGFGDRGSGKRAGGPDEGPGL